jgi:hypothetical protein
MVEASGVCHRRKARADQSRGARLFNENVVNALFVADRMGSYI